MEKRQRCCKTAPPLLVEKEESVMAFYDQLTDTSNFVISFTPNPLGDFGVFAKGYTLGANRLASVLLAAPHFSDYEAYPVVFLYRHALELSLKHIIYTSTKLAAFKYLNDIEHGLHNSHNLEQLAKAAEGLLVNIFPDDRSLHQAVAKISETCHEFSEIDLRSDGYRYPIDRKGQHSTRKHQLVNLRTFADRMSSVLEDLAAIHFGLNIEVDTAQELYETIENFLSSVVKEKEQ